MNHQDKIAIRQALSALIILNSLQGAYFDDEDLDWAKNNLTGDMQTPMIHIKRAIKVLKNV